MYTRLLGRFTPIFHFHRENVLFVYIVKQKRKQNFVVFQIFKNIILIEANLRIWSSRNLPWGHARFHKKIGPDRFSRFDVYWIQTDTNHEKQTDRQAKYKYRREWEKAEDKNKETHVTSILKDWFPVTERNPKKGVSFCFRKRIFKT